MRREQGIALIDVVVVVCFFAFWGVVIYLGNRGTQECAHRDQLKVAVSSFHEDYGVYPQQLVDLGAATKPSYLPDDSPKWHPYVEEEAIEWGPWGYDPEIGVVSPP